MSQHFSTLRPRLAAHEELLFAVVIFDARAEAMGRLAEVLTRRRSRRAEMLTSARQGAC
jgi:hypothetical protein